MGSKLLIISFLIVSILIVSFIGIKFLSGDSNEEILNTYRTTLDPQECLNQKKHVQSLAEDCIFRIVLEKEDVSICESHIFEKSKNNCYIRYAERKSNPEICNNLINLENDGYELRNYRDQCYTKLAEKTADVSLCDKLSSESSQDFCKLKIS